MHAATPLSGTATALAKKESLHSKRPNESGSALILMMFHTQTSQVVSREKTLKNDMEDDRKVKRDVADVERPKRSFKEMQSGVSEEDMEGIGGRS